MGVLTQIEQRRAVMPHVVALDLTHSTETQSPAPAVRHWLLDALYGRELLKAKLRKVRPDLRVSRWAVEEHLDHLLDSMVDELGLRGWPEPKSAGERLRYVHVVLRMMMSVDKDARLPPWRSV